MYCTQSDIENRITERSLIHLTDDEGLNEVNTDRVTESIEYAEGTIEGYCRGRYSVPLAEPVPGIVKNWAIALAVYWLHDRRGKVTEEMGKNYDRIIRELKSVSSGVLQLGVSEAPAAESESHAQTNVDEDSQTFTRDKMEDF